MKVLLQIVSVQRFQNDEPETTTLTTEGDLVREGEAWLLSYAETEMTGLEGTTTIFRLEEGKVTLIRDGAVRSEMIFVQGEEHESLYDMGFGALLISLCAQKVEYSLDETGGSIHVAYRISLEQTMSGHIEYSISVRPRII